MISWGDHIWAQSHVGYKRQTNQDRYLVRDLENGQGVLLAVADGMGGEVGGDIAAQMAIDGFDTMVIGDDGPEKELTRILEQVNGKIRQRAEEDPSLEGMGTTATVVIVNRDTASWSHAGDSRLYHVHEGSLKQISRDHTFVQDLVADGTLSQEEADRHPLRNMLDQCVGCSNLQAESGRFQVMTGDRLLLCSDGLIKHVPDESIRAVLEKNHARQAVEELVRQALNEGGKDNITVVVMDL